MSSHGKPFSLYRRKKTYYCQFKLPDGTWSTAKSTGETSRGRAEAWAVEYLKAGQVVIRENVTFEHFASGFFAWEGDHVTAKRARGLRIGERWCLELDRIVKLKLIPTFGNRKLTDIDENMIARFTIDKYREGIAGSYINKMLIALRAILTAAKKQHLIKFVPDIEKTANKPREKGILTIEEVKALFNVQWRDFRGYVASLLACSSGLRLGELQGLTHEDLHLSENYVHVWRSWDCKGGRFNATTKTGRARSIILPGSVRDEVKRLMEINPWDRPPLFLFFSSRIPDRPMQDRIFSESFYAALSAIGISEEDRRRRNISFHSHRHFLNSLLINKRIPVEKIRTITGHLSPAMTSLYYHPDDYSDIAATVEDALFSVSPPRGDEIKRVEERDEAREDR